MQGLHRYEARMQAATAGFEFQAGGRQEYLRVQLKARDEETVAEKFPNQGSGILTSVAWADALAVVEPGRKVSIGDRLSVLPLK